MASFQPHPRQLTSIQYFIPLILILYSLWVLPPSESAYLASSMVLPGSPVCDDPCKAFPDLCSTGGGLCVLKGPCEYECVCPPDGRRGRDCTGSGAASNPPKESTRGTSNGGSLLDSLLVFPQDLFWDLNHVMRPEESVKMMLSTPPQYFDSESTTTQKTLSSNQTNSTKKSFLNVTTAEPQKYYADTNVTMSVSNTTTQAAAPSQQPSANDQTKSNFNNAPQTTTTQSTVPTTKLTEEITEVTTHLQTDAQSPQPTLSPSTTAVTPQNITNHSRADNTVTDNIPSQSSTISPVNRSKMTSITPDNKDQSSTMIPVLVNDTDMVQSGKAIELPMAPSTNTPIFTSLNPLPIQPKPTNSTSSTVDNPVTTATQQPSTQASSTQQELSSSTPPPPPRPTLISYATTASTPTSQRTHPTINNINLLQLLGTTPINTVLFSNPANLRESFPGHESFPTFFSDVTGDKAKDNGPPNMALSKRVHRVYFPIAQFEKIERLSRVGGN